MISVRSFMKRFPDEQTCRDYLFKIRWPRGFICTKCGENKYSYIQKRHLFECTHCCTQTSITSGTVLHRTKLPLRYWLLVCYWVASGEKCSARKVAKAIQVQYRTALRLLNKIRHAMMQANPQRIHAFWNPFELVEDIIIKTAKTNMMSRARKFIRHAYRKCSSRMIINYYNEYWFRSTYSINPEIALDKLIQFGSQTIYTRNEYIYSNCN